MAAATDYLRILEELGIDTDQQRPNQAHASRILKGRNGERYPGLHINRQSGITYFTVNPSVATVTIDGNLWQNVPQTISVPYFDREKHNIVPRPGQERPALRSLLGMAQEGGFMNSLKAWIGKLTGQGSG